MGFASELINCGQGSSRIEDKEVLQEFEEYEMGLRINTNVASLSAQRSLSNNTAAKNSNMEKQRLYAAKRRR